VGGFLSLAMVWIMPKIRKQSFLPYSNKIATTAAINPIIILDTRYHILDINQATEKLLGCSKQDVLDMDIHHVPLLANHPWDALLTDHGSQTQMTLPKDGTLQQFILQIFTLDNWLARTSGYIISFHNITQSEILADTLQSKSLELQYNYDLQSALSQAVTQMGSSTSPQKALEIMATHLHQLGLEFVLGILDKHHKKILVEFISLDPKFLQKAEKLTRIPVVGYKFSASIWPFPDLFQSKDIIFSDSTFTLVHQLLPQIPELVLKKSYAIVKVPIDEPVMYIPLYTEENPIGAIAIWGYRLQNVSQDILRLFANQTAVTLDNAHRYELEQKTNAELARSKAFTSALSTVAAEIGKTKDLDHVLEVLEEELRKLGFGNLLARLSDDGETATIDYISTSPEALQTIKKFTGINLERYSLKRKYWQKIAEDYFYQGKALFIDNPFEFTSLVIPKIPSKMLAKAVRLSEGHTQDKAIYLPLIEEKHAYGILGIWGTDLREKDIPALSVFASQVSSTMRSAEKIESEREETSKVTRANKFITTLNQVALKLANISNPEQILDILSDELNGHKIFFMIAQLEEESSSLILSYISMPNIGLKMLDDLIKGKAIGTPIHKKDVPFWEEIINDQKSKVFEDSFQTALDGIASVSKIPAKKIETGLKVLFKQAGWNSVSIWHPLIAKGKVIGIINFWGKNLLGENSSTLAIFANQVASALENARLYTAEKEHTETLTASLKETQHLAITDSLTQLHNRRHLYTLGKLEFKRAQRHATPLSLLMIDIDHFKKINDSYSHATGDQVLVDFAQELRKKTRDIDIIGRYGGEEFVVILPSTPQKDAAELAERLRHQIEEKITPATADEKMMITVSIGVASLDEEIHSLESLLDTADTALYEAKRSGRNRVFSL
jgi:diguanylate cyclase (GGDEF)-like protein